MKYLIHGATNGSNFGDCLFAHLFYRYLSAKEFAEVDFLRVKHFGLCKYLADELNVKKLFGFMSADALVYMSGGYFGDTIGDFKETIKRYFRYFWIADVFRILKRDIYICGVGGGPVQNKWLLKKNVQIMNSAKSITVRDQETADFYKKNGVKKEILVTTDTALLVNQLENQSLLQETLNQFNKYTNKKFIFLHVYGGDQNNALIKEKIIPSLNKFLEEFPDKYVVVVGTDNKIYNSIEELEVYKMIKGEKFSVVYTSTFQMLALLKKIDCAITVKLHVGIVSSVYGKSVISFPRHKFKTKRFYDQIGESDRCSLISEIGEEDIVKMLKKYVEQPIEISESIMNKAMLNLSCIE